MDKAERHGTAIIRALSAQPGAEYHARRLRVDGQPVPLAAPYPSLNFTAASLSRSRGIVDSLAVRLCYSDVAIHRQHAPPEPLSCVLFDILEQLRCESLIPGHFIGVRKNLDAAFLAWCQDARCNGLVESRNGMLLYTLIHMVRARLINNRDDEEVAALIETTRAQIRPLIGKPFYRLVGVRHEQCAFAAQALEISRLISHMMSDEIDGESEVESMLARDSVILGSGWDSQILSTTLDGVVSCGGSAGTAVAERLETAGDYGVFTTEFDRVVTGTSLYRQSQRQVLRTDLDLQIRSQGVSVTRLAQRMQRLFASRENTGWLFGQDEGVLDGRRLSQLVSNPSYRQVFRQNRMQPVCDTVVSFLIDNSGSMKSQCFKAVAVLVDTYVRALDLAGARTEILGFTTGDWNGGRSMQAWRRQGMPGDPGRLNEALHIVYKDAETSWKRARSGIASLLKPQHFREGIDGEALLWAFHRLQLRPERRRILVVISDGAPMDAATHTANRPGFMLDHLQSVADFLQRQCCVELGAIGVDLDLSDIYSNSVNLDLSAALSYRSYNVLEELFAPELP